jgi:hypothetical protein
LASVWDREVEPPRIKSVVTRLLVVGVISIAVVSLTGELESPSAATEDLWTRLHRPLHLPRVEAVRDCPRSLSVRRVPEIVGALGRGPAYPTVGSRDGIAYLGPRSDTARLGQWYFRKTIWTVDAAYRGPLLLRGRRVDAPAPLRFLAYGPPSLKRSRRELRWPAGWPTENRTPTGWRQLPGATVLRGPGCYAFQADGLTFSRVIVFRAVLPA